MIQVCSQCGTRWNVRDQERVWCPRCNGTLLAPSGPAPQSPWSERPTATALRPSAQRVPPRLPPGYRWIAVRPGAPPPPRRRRGPLGPTPRYAVMPRWGLVDRFEPTAEVLQAPRGGPSAAAVRATMIATMVVFGVAALVHVVRYGLLIYNRSTLLSPLLAAAATWLGVLVSVAAVFMVVATAVVLTNWLIARRAAAFNHHGRNDPRPVRALRAGCLVPLVNLVWAPVYVIELAHVEDRFARLRRPIIVWWVIWAVSTAVSVFAIAPSFTTDAQGIADNTVTTTIGYLFGLAAVVLAAQVVLGFERNPVERPARRWVIVQDDRPAADGVAEQPDTAQRSDVPVEPEGQNPAA
jgi:Domain of unknown function (DUF4328)